MLKRKNSSEKGHQGFKTTQNTGKEIFGFGKNMGVRGAGNGVRAGEECRPCPQATEDYGCRFYNLGASQGCEPAWKLYILLAELGMVVYLHKASTRKLEAGESGVQT